MTPLIVAAGLTALAFVVLALTRPEISLLVLVGLDITNLNAVLADHLGTSPYKPQLAIAVLALIVLLRRGRFRFGWSPVMLGLLVLLAGFSVTLLSADDPVTAQALLLERARDGLYFVVVLALMLSTHRIREVVAVSVAMLAGLAAVTLFHEVVLHNAGDLFGLSQVPLVQEGGATTARHAGTSSDVNFWARLLILLTPLGLSLWAAAQTRVTRLFWTACVGALIAGTYLTQSRGGFIALLLALLAWLFLAGGRARRSLLLVPVLLAVVIPLSGIGNRLETLTALTATSTATADPSVVTRKRLQLDAWHMFLDSPLTGHGIGSYGSEFSQYDRLSNFYQPVDIVVAAHNFYLEQAADGGILLLMAWAVFFGTIIFTALRVRALSARDPRSFEARMAVGVIAALIGWLVASIFLHLSDFRSVLIVAAVAAALDLRARKVAVVASDPWPDWARSGVRLPTRFARPTRAVLAVIGLTGVIAALGTGSVRFVNSATLAVLPASTQVNGATAYSLDVVSRQFIVPTVAAALDASVSVADVSSKAGPAPNDATRGPVMLTIGQSRQGGAIDVSIVAADSLDAARLGPAAVQVVQTRVAALDSHYQVVGGFSGVATLRPVRRWLALPFALLMLWSLASDTRLSRRLAWAAEARIETLRRRWLTPD